MRKHDVSYHEYDDFIVFRKNYCTHIESFEFFFFDLSMFDAEKSISIKTKKFNLTKILKRNEMFNESKTRLNEFKDKENQVFFRKEFNSLSRFRKLDES